MKKEAKSLNAGVKSLKYIFHLETEPLLLPNNDQRQHYLSSMSFPYFLFFLLHFFLCRPSSPPRSSARTFSSFLTNENVLAEQRICFVSSSRECFFMPTQTHSERHQFLSFFFLLRSGSALSSLARRLAGSLRSLRLFSFIAYFYTHPALIHFCCEHDASGELMSAVFASARVCACSSVECMLSFGRPCMFRWILLTETRTHFGRAFTTHSLFHPRAARPSLPLFLATSLLGPTRGGRQETKSKFMRAETAAERKL